MKDKNKDKVRISVWLTEAENEKLKQYARSCGLSESEFVRQLCKGKTPKPQPPKEFWQMLEALYYVHKGFKEFAKYEPSVFNICKEIECLTGRQTKDLCRIPKDVDFTEKDGHIWQTFTGTV